jgi:hypothetical protein
MKEGKKTVKMDRRQGRQTEREKICQDDSEAVLRIGA